MKRSTSEYREGRRKAPAIWRRTVHLPIARLLGLALVLFSVIGAGTLVAQQPQFFRIGTGSTAGTYFPVGSILAAAISNPPGSRPCDRGGSCGVPGMIAVAQSTQGSVDNVEAVNAALLESAFTQADVAYWAYESEGVYEGKEPLTSLRTIASLFPESIHLVVRKDAGIRKVGDLKGKRVSLDREGSGTRVDALLILKAYGVGVDEIEVYGLSAGAAADQLEQGELDAFFMVVGIPGAAIASLADQSLITLLPLEGPEAEKLREDYPFFSEHAIPSGTYFNVPNTNSLAVRAQWVVNAEVPKERVYDITQALWNESTRRLLDDGHPQGRFITIDSALKGVTSPPLHPGAAQFYKEKGLIPIQ